jgi:hypothetical protein
MYFDIVDCVFEAGGGQTTVENSEMIRNSGIVVIKDAMESGCRRATATAFRPWTWISVSIKVECEMYLCSLYSLFSDILRVVGYTSCFRHCGSILEVSIIRC